MIPDFDTEHCPHCPDGHEHPLTHPWSVSVGPQRDGDGEPIYLMVGKTGLSHVAESDAEWLRELIRQARRQKRTATAGTIQIPLDAGEVASADGINVR